MKNNKLIAKFLDFNVVNEESFLEDESGMEVGDLEETVEIILTNN